MKGTSSRRCASEGGVRPQPMHERRVGWTETAHVDLECIVDFIAEDCAENAGAMLERLQERAEALRLPAELGRVVPELQAVDVLQDRELIERPCSIVYRIEPILGAHASRTHPTPGQ